MINKRTSRSPGGAERLKVEDNDTASLPANTLPFNPGIVAAALAGASGSRPFDLRLLRFEQPGIGAVFVGPVNIVDGEPTMGSFDREAAAQFATLLADAGTAHGGRFEVVRVAGQNATRVYALTTFRGVFVMLAGSQGAEVAIEGAA